MVKKRGRLRKAAAIASIVGALSGLGGAAYHQKQINELKKPLYEIVQIEKELRKPMTLYEFQNLQKNDPKKFKHYMELLKKYEDYQNSPEVAKRDYKIKDLGLKRNLSMVGAGFGATGLAGLLLAEREKRKRKSRILLSIAAISIIGGLFTYSNFTGNIIANSSLASPNIISMILLFIGLISTLFSIKLRR